METSETTRGILDVDLVSASHLQTLLPADLLSQHIVHGNLSDIINSQAQDYAVHNRLEGQYLSDPYEPQDLLSNTDLIEEESKLAAAFVAVQLVQQQKQQCIQEGVIVNAKNDVVTSLSQLTNSGHASVIESLNNSHSLSPEEIPTEYDAQELMENDLTEASVKLFNSITNVRLPSLKKFTQNKRNFPLTRYNIINGHDLNDSHIISSIITNGSQNINLQNNIHSIRPSFINDINTNTIDLGNKLLLHNNSVDLTLSNNDLNNTLLNGNRNESVNSNIIHASENNIVANANQNHLHITNAENLLAINNSSMKSIKKVNGMHINGNTIITNINGTIIKEELDFDAKNCNEDDVQALNEHLNALSNTRYVVSDSDCSDVPTKKTRTSNQQNSSNNSASSSRSLPHKKRISKRLKSTNIKKTVNASHINNSTINSNENINSSSSRSNKKLSGNSRISTNFFACQICGNRFEQQMEFYKHLKFHYEPSEEKTQNYNSNQDHYLEMSNIVNTEHIDSPLLRASLTEPNTILPNFEEDSLPSENLSIQNTCTSINANDGQTQNNDGIMQSQHNINLDSLPNLVISNISGLRCKYCPLIFKRHSALEGHLRDSHFKDDLQDEFSEPEDLMEGIRSVVEASGGQCSDDDVDDIKLNLMDSDKNQRDWYQADELHATEVDLQEIEAEQNNRENQQHQQQQEQQHQQQLQQHQQHSHQLHHQQQHIGESNVCENSSEFEITEQDDDEEQKYEEQNIMNDEQNPKKSNDNDRKCSFVCVLCGDSFDSREQYNEHEADCQMLLCDSDSEVTDKKSIEKLMGPKLNCLQCDRQFNHRNSLMYHIQSHSEKRPYQCEVCGNSFFATSALKVHMRRHSGDKPYQCRICLRHFRQWSDLKYHMVSIHTDVRQYQCEFCGKDFARKYSLIVHRRIHTGEKNYKCEFCNKTFRASSYLQNHRRIHTGEKPYPCEICGKPFRVRGDMKRHMTTHTRDRSGVAANGSSTAKGSVLVPKKENFRNDDQDTGKDFKPDLCADGIPKVSEANSNQKLQQFTADNSDSSASKMHVPKLEILESTAKFMEVNQIPEQIAAVCSESVLDNERLCSPATQPMDLNIASVSKPSNKGCALELQVQVSSNSDQEHSTVDNTIVTTSDQTLNRYTKTLDASEITRDANTVYLWPVYMT